MRTLSINLILTTLVVAGCMSVFVPRASAYGECDDYGMMAMYDSLSDSCTCMSGYVMGKGVMGDTQCVSGNTVCHDKYGYNSSYVSYSKSCECDSGYEFANKYGTTQCVSRDSLCSDQLGYNARYNSLYGKCECRYGYVISGGQCKDADSVCRASHGLYSSYDNIDSCKCDSGYTFDESNQCVEKQNNVYFKLLDLDTNNKIAIIKSDYDSRKYLVTYGTGCYSSAFNRYINKKIVVNLGTDFDVDRYDKIVLQDDDETCEIRQRERTYDDSLQKVEETDYAAFIPTYTNNPSPITAVAPAPAVEPLPVVTFKDFDVASTDVERFESSGYLASAAAFRKCPGKNCSVIRYYAEDSEVSITGKYLKDDWYQVLGTTNAGGTGTEITGYIHASLFSKVSENGEAKKAAVADESGFDFSKFDSQVSNARGEDKDVTSNDKALPQPSVFQKVVLWFASWFR